MGFVNATNYRGYQINTLVQPNCPPATGFVGYVSVEINDAEVVRGHTDVLSHLAFAETAARQLGHEMVDLILGPFEANPD